MDVTIVCGIDEAGRGPLCGPVTAAAVVLPPDFELSGIRDSKKLTAGAREAAAARIRSDAAWGIGWADAAEIDKFNILEATFLAMRRAFAELERHSKFPGGQLRIVVDGNRAPKIGDWPVDCLVGGDDLEPAISAASILAKTARDSWIADWVAEFDPADRYGLLKHKGYPTAMHRARIAELGLSSIHRRSFRVSAG